MTKIYVVLFVILFLIFSCSKKEDNSKESKVEIYQKDKVSFNLPNSWKVLQDYSKDGNRYIELDKYSNYKVESTMAISIIEQNYPVDSILKDQIKQLQFFYQKINFKILKDHINTMLGKYNAVTTFYEADDTKNKVYGQVSIIKDNHKTISVQIVENQPNVDNKDYNNIFNSFIIK